MIQNNKNLVDTIKSQKYFYISYILEILIYDYVYKGLIRINKYILYTNEPYIYINYIYNDFGKYNVFINARFYKNFRLSFLNVSLISRLKRRIIENKKNLTFIKYYTINNTLIKSLQIIQYLILSIMKINFRYRLGLYMESYNSASISYTHLFWNDMFSREKDLYDLITYRNRFYYKYDIPRNIYHIYMYTKNFQLNLMYVYITFFGFKLFFNKKNFRYRFYSRII